MQFSHHLPALEHQESRKPSLCILARKNLTRNTRVVRQAKALSQAGFNVTVVAIELPHPDVRALTPEVNYIQVLSKPKSIEFLRWVHDSMQADFRGSTGRGGLRFSRFEIFFYSSIIVVGLRLLQTAKSNRVVGRIKWYGKKVVRFVAAPLLMRVFIGEKEVWRSTLRRARTQGKQLLRKVWAHGVSSLGTVEDMDSLRRGRMLLKQRTAELFARTATTPFRPLSPEHLPLTESVFGSMISVLKKFVRQNLWGRASGAGAGNMSPKGLKGLVHALSNAVQTVYFAWNADKVLKEIPLDYCQAHDSYALLATEIVAHHKGAKVIYDALEIVDDRSGAWKHAPSTLKAWEDRRDHRIINEADLVFAVGGEVAKWTSRRYDINMPVVVRNCSLFIDEPSENGQIRETLGLPEQDKIVLLVGSVYRGQGVKALIESLSHLARDIHLVLLGFEAQKGYFDELKEYGARFGVLDRFHILDPCPPHMVSFVASGADIGVIARPQGTLNNLYSLPNKVFEYIMARLPIASARLPDIRALVEGHGIGMIFNEEDPKDIASVVTALTEPETLLEMKERVRRAARELCWEREGQRYVEAIKRLGNEQWAGETIK